MDKKTATVQYRYVNTQDLWEGFNLKDMVVDILRRSAPTGAGSLFQDVSARKIDLDHDGSYVVLNKLSTQETWDGPLVCGQLIHVKAGTQLPGIDGDLDQAIPEFSLQQLNLGESKQLVEGILYFAIGGNHVGLIEGQRTRARTLERYLTSLLQRADELEVGKPVLLNAKLEGKVKSVREMEITPERVAAATSGNKSGATVSSDAGDAEGQGKTVFDILRVLGWTEEDLANLESKVPTDGWVEGKLKVLFKQKGRRSAAINRTDLETALRNIDDKTIGLLGDGAKEKSGTIKLSAKPSIGVIGDMLDPEQAMNAIAQSLRAWSTSGRIDYTFDP